MFVLKNLEKLILFLIKTIETENNVDLSGKSQRGFKEKHSTLRAGLKLQSLIVRACDDNNYTLMASLDLAF